MPVLSSLSRLVLRASPHMILIAALGGVHRIIKWSCMFSPRCTGSNEPWRWMLSDLSGLQPQAPPRVYLPSTCLREECVHHSDWVKAAKLTDSEKSSRMRALHHATNIFSFSNWKYANTCTQRHVVTVIFQSG